MESAHYSQKKKLKYFSKKKAFVRLVIHLIIYGEFDFWFHEALMICRNYIFKSLLFDSSMPKRVWNFWSTLARCAASGKTHGTKPVEEKPS